jgi:excisionase family DNA binding protein
MQQITTNGNKGALKVASAARFLDVSIPTMRRLIAKGDIRVVRKLRHLLVPIEALNEWLSK